MVISFVGTLKNTQPSRWVCFVMWIAVFHKKNQYSNTYRPCFRASAIFLCSLKPVTLSLDCPWFIKKFKSTAEKHLFWCIFFCFEWTFQYTQHERINDRSALTTFHKKFTSNQPSANFFALWLLTFERYKVLNIERFGWRIFFYLVHSMVLSNDSFIVDVNMRPLLLAYSGRSSIPCRLDWICEC